MSTSRRAFFKGLCGGIGALGLGNVILSQTSSCRNKVGSGSWPLPRPMLKLVFIMN
jgi:hypothetical protein